MRIAVTGPESSGKTTLAIQLASRLDLVLLPELCREYLSQLSGPYVRNDVLAMAANQHRQYWLHAETGHHFVADTESLVMRIWYEEKYRLESEEIMDMWLKESFDLYLLCAPDIPWEDDPLRENPHDRDRLYVRYRNELVLSGRPFAEVKGLGELRLSSALAAIDRIS